MGSENGVRYFETQFQLHFALETVLNTLKKYFGYFRLKKTVLNNLGKIFQEITNSENGVRFFK